MARKNHFELRLNNGNVLTLNGIKEVYGHNDTLPYNADFKLADANGNIIIKGIAYNDGWGGESNMDLEIGKRSDIANIDQYFIDNLSFDHPTYKFHLEMKLIDVIDNMADVFIANPRVLNNSYTKEDNFLAFLKGENLHYWKMQPKKLI